MNPTKEPTALESTIGKSLDGAYNMAIDHAIKIIKAYFGYPVNSDDPHGKPIIDKLEKLKK